MAKASTITQDMIPALLSVAGKTRNPVRDHALVLFMIETGARPCELASLTFDSLCDAAGRLVGRATWKAGKGGNQRSMPLSADLIVALWPLLPVPFDRHAHVFRSQRGEALEAQSIRAGLIRIWSDAGFDVSAYSFRRLFMERLAETVSKRRAGPAAMLKISGHKHLSSIEHYLTASTRAIEDIEADLVASAA